MMFKMEAYPSSRFLDKNPTYKPLESGLTDDMPLMGSLWVIAGSQRLDPQKVEPWREEPW